MTFSYKSLLVIFVLIFSGGFPMHVLGGAPDDSSFLKQINRPAYVPQEILVRVKDRVDRDDIQALHRRFGGDSMRRSDRSGIHRVRFGKGVDIERVIERYRASGLVVDAERHAVRYPQAAAVPDDPYYAEQWGVNTVDARNAWSIRRTDRTVVVAVIDTGIDYTHPDLQHSIWVNEAEKNGIKGIDDDGNGYVDDGYGWDFADNDADPMDYAGHGTHVAGIIGAMGDNGIGVAGVSWNVRLMPLKVAGDYTTGMESGDILDALNYALENGATVFNCSFGGPYDSAIEYDKLKILQQSGVMVICAAGNKGTDIDQAGNAMYPASYDLANIIAVAASAKDGSMAGISNYGSISVDLMAPGVDILSAKSVKITAAGANERDLYKLMTGTSMAVPHVSGLVALMRARQPELGLDQIKSAILETVVLDPTAAGKTVSGGRVNFYDALGEMLTPGDITGDDRVQLDDLITTLQILTGILPAGPVVFHPGKSDINADGRIGLEEAIYILNQVSH